jgi:putative iron-regulated protein
MSRGAPEAGIINDAGATISGEALAGLNEAGGEKNIATGYHAIEFLLWGQDMDPNGPGARPHTDFVEGEGGTAANQGRRKQYLGAVSALLEEHLTQVKDAWAPGQENYRAEFEAASREEALRRILTGMIVLSGFETGGERLQAALDSGEQEDEHSCFSDNTHRDMVQDVVGVRNVWLGSYTRLDGSKVEGAGVRDVVMAVDAELAQELDAQMDMSVALAEDLRVPFDQEISPANEVGRMRVQALVQSLRQQENLLERVFLKFGLTIPVVE